MIRVLIVDDDKLARMGLLTVLPWARYDMQVVGEAANGAKALEFLEHNGVDLAFVDLMMPVMSGLDFIKAARAKYPNLQFVVLTFHEDFSFVQSALRLGVLDYISKLELENADYEAICARLMDKLKSESPAIASEGQPTWTSQLNSRCWIYDHVALTSLSQKMKEEPIPPASLERLLVRSIVTAEYEFALPGPAVPTMHDMDAATRYMAHFRQALMNEAAQSTDLSKLPVCLMKAIQLVHANLGGNLHTESIAAKVGLSRPYFSSSFSKEVGLPFNAYVRRERVIAAKQLLTHTQMNISAIAAKVGYEDARSFTKLFFDHTGETPTAYREQNSTNSKQV